MARTLHRLKPMNVKAITKRGLHADGGGLYVQVSKFDTKSWIFRFSLNKRSRQMGLGSVEHVSLSEARSRADECRRLLREGLDPIEHRKVERAKKQSEASATVTFKACAEEYIKSHSAGWKNLKHAKQWESTLKAYAYPHLENVAVQDVSASLIMKVLEPIWIKKTETANRIRGRIEAILDFAKVHGYRDGDNPARWRGHLDHLLPARSKVRKVKNHPALPYDQIHDFMKALQEQTSISARGLEFLILTASRTSEVLGATWDEIDLSRSLWTVPEARMKAKKAHKVPLSGPASSVLECMKAIQVSNYVFPGARPSRPLSNMAFLQLLKRMEYADITAHGFRSTFRDWAAECTSAPKEVAEMALAHAISNDVEAAYRRGDLLAKRKELMEDWGLFCVAG